MHGQKFLCDRMGTPKQKETSRGWVAREKFPGKGLFLVTGPVFFVAGAMHIAQMAAHSLGIPRANFRLVTDDYQLRGLERGKFTLVFSNGSSHLKYIKEIELVAASRQMEMVEHYV